MSALLSAPTTKRTELKEKAVRVSVVVVQKGKGNHLAKVGELAINVASKVTSKLTAPEQAEKIVGTETETETEIATGIGIETGTEIETKKIDDHDQSPGKIPETASAPEIRPGTAQGIETIETIVETNPGTDQKKNGKTPDEKKTKSENSEDREPTTRGAEVRVARAEAHPDREMRGVFRERVPLSTLTDQETRIDLVLASLLAQVEHQEQPILPVLPLRRKSIDQFANCTWQRNATKANLAMIGTPAYVPTGTKTKSTRIAHIVESAAYAIDQQNHAVDHRTDGPKTMRNRQMERQKEQQRGEPHPPAPQQKIPTMERRMRRNLLADAVKERRFRRKVFPCPFEVKEKGGEVSLTR